MAKNRSPHEVLNVSETPFGAELRRLRRAANLTLVDLAAAADCSVVYVSQVERGDKSPPTPQKIEAMLRRIGCPQRTEEMLALAARSRRAIEIGLKDKSAEETDMLLALQRKSEAGEISVDLAQRISELLQRGK
jgi:transcriptional regulator with XRE-family HTH domain